MLRFYFWVLCTKNFELSDLPFWRYGVKVSTFPPFPQKLGGHIPSIFCTGYPSDDPPKPWKFCESLANSFRDILHFTVQAYGRDNQVSYTLITESLYSDEYFFTDMLRVHGTDECLASCWSEKPPASSARYTGARSDNDWCTGHAT